MKSEVKKKVAKVFFDELLANAIGYGAGLVAFEIVRMFFVKKGIGNLWGLATKKTAVSGTMMELLNVVIAGLVGFAVFSLINYFFTKKQVEEQIEEGTEGQ